MEDVLQIFFIVVFGIMLVLNVAVIFKYKVYENSSSLFIIILLAIIDIFRIATMSVNKSENQSINNSEFWNRIGHDTPSMLFDCVTIAILLQFAFTYDVLANPQRALIAVENNVYKKL